MKELVYGIMYSANRPGAKRPSHREVVDNLVREGATGLYLIDPVVDDAVAHQVRECREAGLDVILGFREVPDVIDEERLENALSLCRKLALGTGKATHEWGGDAKLAKRYLEMQEQRGFEWVCPLTHQYLCIDYAGGQKLRGVLRETLCLCLCGYVLAGKLFGDPEMPHQGFRTSGVPYTTLSGHDIRTEFGMTPEGLREYLEPMRVLSGAGMQHGLDHGSWGYARRLGFKGLVVGMPFSLESVPR